MPAPAVYIAACITAVVTGYVFIRFVYEPHIAPVLERTAEDYLERRRARSRRLATPVDAAPPPPPPDGDGGDIPLNDRRTRRRTRSSTSHSDESGNEESAPLLGAQSSTNVNGNVNATLRRRPVPAVPDTIHELGSTIAREESNVNENANSTATSPGRRDVFDINNNNNNNHLSGSQHRHLDVAAVPTTSTVLPSPSPSGVSRSDVHEWRNAVALNAARPHEGRRRRGQGQPMRPAINRRPLLSPSTAPGVPFVPALPPPPPPPPAVFHVLDEPNPDSLPQTPIYPTHVITDSSVPSTPSTMSGSRSVMFTPPPQLSPLRSSTISTNAGINGGIGASGTDLSELSVLDPWNGALSASAIAASLQTDGRSGDGQLGAPQLPLFSPLSSMHASTHQPTPVRSPQLPTPLSPPYLLTPSAQHPHHVHYPVPPNIAAVASSSPTTVRGAIAPAQAQAPISSSPTLSLSQFHPVLLDAVIFDATPLTSPVRSPAFSDPVDLVVPGSPGPFGSPGSEGSLRPSTLSPQSPFIPLSIPPLPISPPLPPSAARNGTQRRQPLDLLGSAASMTTTIRPSSSFNPPPHQSSPASSMFYSFTNDGPARPPPAAASGGILSFPSEASQQQHKSASPGVMSPMLSELEFVSELGGSEFGSSDDIRSESSWSSARF